jgi:hypothetical protein
MTWCWRCLGMKVFGLHQTGTDFSLGISTWMIQFKSYLHKIYTVLDVISNLEVISVQGRLCHLCTHRVPVDFGNFKESWRNDWTQIDPCAQDL